MAKNLRLNKWITLFLTGLFLFLAISSGMLESNNQAKGSVSAAESDKEVYVVPVHGTIERGLYAFMRRAFEDANEEGADMILLDIDTPGGTLDAAFEIKDLITQEELRVVAYVSGRAMSAGAFLALASDELYMRRGSNMGAAEARAGEEIADEKIMSAWESEMRSVAEMRGRDPEIAAAMVRQEMEIEGLVESGRLLTLSSAQALEHEMADGEVANQEELFEMLGFEGAEVTEYPMEWAERLARFLTSPVVASILMSIGMAGIIIELTSSGFGIAGAVGLLSFALFFGGHIFAGLAGYEVLLFFALGIILLLIEALAAGFGVFGLLGLVSSGFAIVLSAESTEQGLMILLYSILGTIVVLVVAFRFIVRSKFLDRIILKHTEDKDQGYVGTNVTYKDFLNKEGVTETPLRPAGTAIIEGDRVDVVSEGGYIPGQSKIKVVKVEGSRIVVRKIDDPGE
ncbi:NfeD family protein [Natranaerofaba carboxydovora]|uniref:NfeD family protein n=1 Tax=Natranaerofaba carboxydovora TaxID=2742683 RepID=UPI001F131A9E|nr:nodulation protein NfeD [Natranaerofaba carboxydovora]UMZ72898.1 hypothetical protein ACONDI_00436 [Natranaerofaba carboxydovora]